MQPRLTAVILTLLFCWENAANTSRAAVIVFANRTDQEVRFTISWPPASSQTYTIPKDDLLTLPLSRGTEVVFSADGKQHRYHVHLNEIYYFIGQAKTLKLQQVGFSGSGEPPHKPLRDGEEEPTDQADAKTPKVLLKIPVKILVDQAEPNVQQVWEKRLRRRIDDASDILQRYCRVRLEVVEVGTWESNDKLMKLSELLGDFRGKVATGKARLAIGFTGLRPEKNEDVALGCTPGPLSTHILVREYRLRSESERLEVLIHELGHFLGACHSPEGDSVMRPKLGDGLANLRAYRMGFDPVNTLVMNLIAEEIAFRPVHSLGALRAGTRRRLLDIFATLTRAMPQDPAPPLFVRMLGPRPPEPVTVRSLPPAVLEGTRSVVAAITDDAKRNQRSKQLGGDALTTHYFRLAADKCRQLPADVAPTAFTLGLAIALDRGSLLRSLGLNGIAWSKLESDAERRQRLEVLGEPTMQGQTSLMRSFLVSAAFTLLVEGQAIEAAGLQEELLLLQGGDRFPFSDLMACLAGSNFATQLDASPDLLDELATSFRISDYLPSPKGLPNPIARDEFTRRFGSMTDERFLEPQDALRQRLLSLPGYRPRSSRKEGRLPIHLLKLAVHTLTSAV